MSPLRDIRSAAQESTGAVLVFVALCLPVFIGFGGLVLDVGNWFAHKRHLQLQADAGALAGAGKFRYPCDSGAITDEVSKYSSVDTSGISFNPQIGSTPASELHQEINSETFFDQSSPVDGDVIEGAPCSVSPMIDVKLTETDLPWWLKLASVPYINAHARVEIRQKALATGALPVGVPEVRPKKAKAIFVDESKLPSDTGYVLASTDLVNTGSSGGLATWSNAAAPKAVTINAARIGVRIVVSGSTSTTCGDPLVACYDAGAGNNNGLVFIRGYANTPAGGDTAATPPQARDVRLFGGTCTDGYFTASATTCTENISAVVSFGGAAVSTTRVLVKQTGTNDNTAVALTAPTTAGQPWTGGALSIATGSGPVSLDLLWRANCTNSNCTGGSVRSGSLGTVQRTFAAADARSGPIKLVRVSETGVAGANSFERCSTCTHNLVVTLGLQDNLANAQSVSDPIVSLKIAGGGSQNQALDCGPTLSNFQQEIAQGCPERYKVNEGTACPGNGTALWATPEPWDCVAIETGAAVGQVTHGLNERMFDDTNANQTRCPDAPNNWANFPNFSASDRRIVQVFITPFGAFGGSGSNTVPVLGFATFYVTGWDGGPCQHHGDDDAGQGSIVGHFIKYIDTINNGEEGEDFCDVDAFGSCVAVFTR